MLKNHFKDQWFAQMVVIIQRCQCEHLDVEHKRMAEQQKALRVLHAIDCWPHRVYSSPKMTPEFVEI